MTQHIHLRAVHAVELEAHPTPVLPLEVYGLDCDGHVHIQGLKGSEEDVAV